MDFKENKGELVTRLACCTVAALIVCYGAEKYGEVLHLSLLDPYLPWLRENKIQAVAIAAAVLFGASLALFPLEKSSGLPPEGPPDPPCGGYEPVGGL